MTHIFDDVEDWFRRRDQLRRYPDPQTPPAPEAPVSNLLDGIRAEIPHALTLTEDELRQILPSVAKAADDADALAGSTAAQAVLGAVLSPEDEAFIVDLVKRLDQGTHEADTAVQNLHAGEPPADPEPEPAAPADEQPVAVAAGPVVGGTAR